MMFSTIASLPQVITVIAPMLVGSFGSSLSGLVFYKFPRDYTNDLVVKWAGDFDVILLHAYSAAQKPVRKETPLKR